MFAIANYSHSIITWLDQTRISLELEYLIASISMSYSKREAHLDLYLESISDHPRTKHPSSAVKITLLPWKCIGSMYVTQILFSSCALENFLMSLSEDITTWRLRGSRV